MVHKMTLHFQIAIVITCNIELGIYEAIFERFHTSTIFDDRILTVFTKIQHNETWLDKLAHFGRTIYTKQFRLQRHFISFNKLLLKQTIMGNQNKGLGDTEFSIHWTLIIDT